MMEDIIKKAEEYALSEIEKYGLPSILNFNTSNKKAEELAKKFDVDENIVKIGIRLIDIKLGEAAKQGKINEHVKMSTDAAEKFLSQFNIPQETKIKIFKCVAGHHSTFWDLKEAEICANADCYRFLLVKNWLVFLHSLGERGDEFEKSLKYAKEKAEEKWNILSLEICKKELTSHYKIIREIINKAKS